MQKAGRQRETTPTTWIYTSEDQSLLTLVLPSLCALLISARRLSQNFSECPFYLLSDVFSVVMLIFQVGEISASCS
jgi:hypothetical protein